MNDTMQDKPLEETTMEETSKTSGNEQVPDLNMDDNLAGTTHLSEDISEEGTSSALQKERDDWKDQYLRLSAEFDNYKKRSFREKMEVIQTAGKDVIVSLLDIMDDMSRAEKQMESATDVQAVKEGLNLVFSKLRHNLQQKGLKAFDSIGEPFDVEKHEAVTEIPAPNPEMAGKVIDELHKGYYLNDRLIRHAKVVVGKTTEN